MKRFGQAKEEAKERELKTANSEQAFRNDDGLHSPQNSYRSAYSLAFCHCGIEYDAMHVIFVAIDAAFMCGMACGHCACH
jgi:hypothetical protein